MITQGQRRFSLLLDEPNVNFYKGRSGGSRNREMAWLYENTPMEVRSFKAVRNPWRKNFQKSFIRTPIT